jgi:hypothetical protein
MPIYVPGKVVLRKDYIPLDASYNNVSLLLHGDGPNGSTTITDNSPTPKTVTAVGNAQISTAQSKFGGSSMLFDKVDDRLTLAASSDFAFGTGDFTIEFWAYSRDVLSSTQRGFLQISPVAGGLSTSFVNSIIIVQGANAGGSGLNGGLVAVINNTFIGSSTAVLSTNTWFHVALTRASGTVRLFFNGNVHASSTNTSNLTGSNLVVGGYYDTTVLYDGYIDDLRITKGVARYTANFTPPTEPFPDRTDG